MTKHLVTEGYEYFSYEIAAVVAAVAAVAVAAVAVAATVDVDAAKLKKQQLIFQTLGDIILLRRYLNLNKMYSSESLQLSLRLTCLNAS